MSKLHILQNKWGAMPPAPSRRQRPWDIVGCIIVQFAITFNNGDPDRGNVHKDFMS